VTNKINKINIQEFIIYEIIIDYKSEAWIKFNKIKNHKFNFNLQVFYIIV
jgi:hypothetical protein